VTDKVPKNEDRVSYFRYVLFFWISWPLKMEPKGCPKMSATNHHSILHNI